jgi:uncharacterized protein
MVLTIVNYDSHLTFLQHLSEQKLPDRAILYVTMDNLANPYVSLMELAEQFQRQGGKQLIIDEIHK